MSFPLNAFQRSPAVPTKHNKNTLTLSGRARKCALHSSQYSRLLFTLQLIVTVSFHRFVLPCDSSWVLLFLKLHPHPHTYTFFVHYPSIWLFLNPLSHLPAFIIISPLFQHNKLGKYSKQWDTLPVPRFMEIFTATIIQVLLILFLNPVCAYCCCRTQDYIILIIRCTAFHP